MSTLGLLLLGSLATALFLTVALAFARAVLYANVLTELDGAHEIQRRLRRRRRAARSEGTEARREWDDSLALTGDTAPPTAHAV